MAQIVPGAPNIGQQLGSGLSAGLSALAEQKFAQLARREAHREKASRLIGLGIPPQEADYLAGIQDSKYGANGNAYASKFLNGPDQSYGEQTPQVQPQQQAPQQNLEQLAGNVNQIPGANASPEQLMLQSLASGNPLSPIQAELKSIESPQVSQQQVLGGGQQPPMGTPQSTEQEEMIDGHPMPQELKDFISELKQPGSNKKTSKKLLAQGDHGAPPGINATQQTGIEQKNALYNKEFGRRRNSARDFLKLAPRLEEDILSGEILSPREAALQEKLGSVVKPYNSRTSSFVTDANKLALLELYMSPGEPTEGKLEAHQLAKPNLTQTDDVKLERVRDIKDKATEILLEEEARNQLLEENGGFQPRNFEDVAIARREKLKKEYIKQQKEELKMKFKAGAEFDGLPDARYAPSDARLQGENGVMYKPVKGKWVPE